MNDARNSRRKRRMIIVLIIAVALVVLITRPFPMGTNFITGRSNWPTEFDSNGAQIYFTGTSASGLAIKARGGTMRMGMMADGGCATCHGVDRQGARLMPRFWKSAPPLTPDALFGDQEEDAHGDHGAYSDETLERAITRGIDAGGERLDRAMPQWSMAKQDLEDLIAFLKSSGTG